MLKPIKTSKIEEKPSTYIQTAGKELSERICKDRIKGVIYYKHIRFLTHMRASKASGSEFNSPKFLFRVCLQKPACQKIPFSLQNHEK